MEKLALIIDTSNSDLFVSIVKNKKTIVSTHLENCEKKSEKLPLIVSKMFQNKKLKNGVKALDEIYVNKGPGSFMGVRAGVLFAKTLAYTLKIKLYACDNLLFISNGQDGTYHIDAKGGLSYQGIVSKGEAKIELVDFKENSKIDYGRIKKKPQLILNLFKLVDNIHDFEPLYIKEPQVGGKV